MPPHGMDVTGTDYTQMPGIGHTFSGYLSMITSSIRVACRNSQFRGTHKFLRGHHVFEETLLRSLPSDHGEFNNSPDRISRRSSLDKVCRDNPPRMLCLLGRAASVRTHAYARGRVRVGVCVCACVGLHEPHHSLAATPHID